MKIYLTLACKIVSDISKNQYGTDNVCLSQLNLNYKKATIRVNANRDINNI
jgi:hypothetical protein